METERLIIRRFTEADAGAVLRIYSDVEVNEFLPMFPLTTQEQAVAFLRESYLQRYITTPDCHHYAVCLKEDDTPVGFVNIADNESRDFGYGLGKEFWHRGIITEAAKAVVSLAAAAGLPYLTATHDIKNPRSGGVMRNIGMKYCYTYEESVQPKNTLVHFRMYQLNLDGCTDRVYRWYWNRYANHYIEDNL